jgi:hypothetical protein
MKNEKLLTNTKILKLLRAKFPHIRWQRLKGYDIPENDEMEAHNAFAGVRGKEGIRFKLSVLATKEEVALHAQAVAGRLIRGDGDPQ